VLNFYEGPEEAVSIRKGLFVMVTAVKAARHICLSPSRFRDLVDAGVFARMPPGKYDLTTVREAYCLHAQRVMAGRGDDGGKSLSERRARLADAQAQAAEMKNAIMRGDYVSLRLVGEAIEREYSIVRERVLTTPGKCADSLTPYTPKDRKAILEILRDEAHAALTDLSTPAFMDEMREAYAKRRTKPHDDTHEELVE
jgi:phage terminase Nu1 subunit (DNA packaging protein)